MSVASEAVKREGGGRREARWTSERWERSRRWRRYGRKANERVVPWKELVQNPGNPIRGPRDTGHPATNWNSSVAAEARLSIIETWPDRQKIQRARGKLGEGAKGKGCAVSRSILFPLFEQKSKFSKRMTYHVRAFAYAQIYSNVPWNYMRALQKKSKNRRLNDERIPQQHDNKHILEIFLRVKNYFVVIGNFENIAINSRST